MSYFASHLSNSSLILSFDLYSNFYDAKDDETADVAEFSDGWSEFDVTISSPKRKREKKKKSKKVNKSKRENAKRLNETKMLI